MAVVAQAKNTYNLRNRTVNADQGTPRNVFIKDQNYKNNMKPTQKESGKTEQNKTKDKIPVEEKGHMKIDKNDQIVSPSFDIAQAISQVKISVPLLEMMKVDKYRNIVVKIISDIPNQEQ